MDSNTALFGEKCPGRGVDCTLTLSRIRELNASGRTTREIAEELNRQGFTTRRGTAWRFQYVAEALRVLRRFG